MPRQELPMESANKYGKWDDDVTELASGIDPTRALRHGRNSADPELQDAEELDEDFLRTLGSPKSHYGQ